MLEEQQSRQALEERIEQLAAQLIQDRATAVERHEGYTDEIKQMWDKMDTMEQDGIESHQQLKHSLNQAQARQCLVLSSVERDLQAAREQAEDQLRDRLKDVAVKISQQLNQRLDHLTRSIEQVESKVAVQQTELKEEVCIFDQINI